MPIIIGRYLVRWPSIFEVHLCIRSILRGRGDKACTGTNSNRSLVHRDSVLFFRGIHVYHFCRTRVLFSRDRGQHAGVGDRTCTGTYSNHPRPVSGAPTPHTCCKTIGACRAPPLTYYGIPGTWYLVPGRQHRPISSCFSDTRRAYHVPACTSLLPDTVDGATSWGKKRLAPTTSPVDSTLIYMVYVGIM